MKGFLLTTTVNLTIKTMLEAYTNLATNVLIRANSCNSWIRFFDFMIIKNLKTGLHHLFIDKGTVHELHESPRIFRSNFDILWDGNL